MQDFESREYKRSRSAYVVQCTLEHLLGLMVVDVYLAKLLSHIGLSDAMVGVIASFVSVAFVFQLLAMVIVKTKLSTKKAVIIADCLSQLCFMFLYFIPFLPTAVFVKKLLVILSVVVAYVGKYSVLTLYFKWANTYVQPWKRGIFSANKECISLVCGIVFAAVMGYVIDAFEESKNLETGFLVIAITLLVINVLNFVCLVRIKDEEKAAQEAMRMRVGDVLSQLKTNKTFIMFVVSSSISALAGGFITGFVGIYKINDLLLSVFVVQIMNIIADFLRLLVSKPFGKFSDRFGFAKGMELAYYLLVVGYFSIIFTTPQTKYLIIIYTVLLATSNAGTYQNSFNIGYQMLPNNLITQAMAIKSVFSGIFSFSGAIIAGVIVNWVQSNNNTVFGLHLYAQQLLAVIAVIVKILALFLFRKYVSSAVKKVHTKL